MGDDNSLVISIDFGTTFSGAAYAFSNSPDQLFPIESWPHPEGSADRPIEYSSKVPTKLWYPSRGGRPEWGFKIPNDAPADEVLRLFKM